MRRLVLALALVFLIAVTGQAALIILHPGTVTGSTGLTHWTFTSSWVSVGGNANGFFGSKSFSGTPTYEVTVEGAQTYGYVSQSLSGTNVSFSESVNTSFTVPINGVVTQNLLAPGGTVQVDASVVGATLTRLDVYTSGSTGSTYYSGYGTGYASTVLAPMGATAGTVTVSGYAYLSRTDSNGNTCPQYQYFSTSFSGLAEGATQVVTQTFDLSGVTCETATGSLTGTIGLSSLPAAVTLDSGYVYTIGVSYQYANFSSAPFTYLFSSLAPGWYYTYQGLNFAAPYESSLSLPGNGYGVQVLAGQTATRDFGAAAATVEGSLSFSGPLATTPFSGSLSFQPDYTGGGLPANAYANTYVPLDGSSGPPASYGAVLTAGPWRLSSIRANVYGSSQTLYSNFTDNSLPALNPVAGDQLSLPLTIDTSSGDLVFDVIEPAGSTTPIDIAYPRASLNMYDAATQRYGSISVYGSMKSDTPQLHVIGAPGHYTVDGYGYVADSYTKFVSSTIDLGAPVNTPAGDDVAVTLLDANGHSLNVSLLFSHVATGGDTTGSSTDIGPALPGAFSFYPVFNGSHYLSINTSAIFTGSVKIAIQYDPVALGISPASEPALQLWHYHCDASNNCAWDFVKDLSKNPNPDTTITAHTIYGITDTFSLFAVLLPEQSAPSVSCVGTAASPSVVAAAGEACGISVDNANGLAGSCADAGGGLASCTFDGAASKTLGPGSYSVLVKGTAGDGSSAECTSYVQVVDMQAPSIACPEPATVECAGASTPFAVAATSTDDCGTSTVHCAPSSFPLGTSTAACTAVDPAGNQSSCSAMVTVVDTQPPVIASLAASPGVLAHGGPMVPVSLVVSVSDACGGASLSCRIVSVQNPSPGPQHDYDITGPLTVNLHPSHGGAFTVTVRCTDAAGNSSENATTIPIQKKNGK